MKQLIVVALTCLTLGATAQAEGRSDTFRALLAHVPNSFLGPITDRWDIDYSDLRAAAVAISAPPEGTNDMFLTDLGPLIRVNLLQTLAVQNTDALADWPGLVGFDASQINAAITVQKLPESAAVLQLDPGAATGALPVLLANGYAQTDQMGYPALFRGEADLMIDSGARNFADPFGAGLGMSSRIGVQGDVLLQSRSWPLLTEMMQASGAVLSEQPEISALLTALDAAPADLGGLVQVKLLTDPLGFGVYELTETMPTFPQSDLPFWSMGLIADLAAADTETAVIALLYPTQAMADGAAAILQDRWTTQPNMTVGRSLSEITGALAVTSVSGSGPFVVLLTATLPTAAHSGMLDNRIWSALVRGYYQRDLLILAPAMP